MAAEGEPGLSSKQKKERENAALQSSLRGPWNGTRAPCDGDTPRVGEERAQEQGSPQVGGERAHEEGSARVGGERAQEEEGSPRGGEQVLLAEEHGMEQDEKPQSLPSGDQELTLTDHLNKRLLLSFQEKLNQAGDGLLQRVQQNQAGEDDNQTQEEW